VPCVQGRSGRDLIHQVNVTMVKCSANCNEMVTRRKRGDGSGGRGSRPEHGLSEPGSATLLGSILIFTKVPPFKKCTSHTANMGEPETHHDE
jgi:hypothetical protein